MPVHRHVGRSAMLPIVAIAGLLCFPQGSVAQAPSAAEAATIWQQIRAEEARPVGQPLPSDLTALDNNGKTVRLRDVMHGPAIVAKVENGCPPCDELVQFLRDHGPAYAKAHDVQIVVLNTASPDDPGGARYPKDLPPGIVTLHRTDMMLDGFLGGGYYPYLFFFDKDLTLVGRRIDVRTPIEATFAFPKATRSRPSH